MLHHTAMYHSTRAGNSSLVLGGDKLASSESSLSRQPQGRNVARSSRAQTPTKHIGSLGAHLRARPGVSTCTAPSSVRGVASPGKKGGQSYRCTTAVAQEDTRSFQLSSDM
ncbi:unnamed protein product, partial [Ectocarpus sp. 12 AP-2014]